MNIYDGLEDLLATQSDDPDEVVLMEYFVELGEAAFGEGKRREECPLKRKIYRECWQSGWDDAQENTTEEQ